MSTRINLSAWSIRHPVTPILVFVVFVALVVQDHGAQNAGWLALAVHGVGLFALARWTPRFQYVAALAPAEPWTSMANVGAW